MNISIVAALAALIAIIFIPTPKIRTIINPIAHSGYGACGRCGRTWDVVHGHSTPYADSKWTVTVGKLREGERPEFTVDGVPNDGQPHEVVVANGDGCFPLCEQCWGELTPEQRLPYYRTLLDSWKSHGNPEVESKWTGMKAAVLAGK